MDCRASPRAEEATWGETAGAKNEKKAGSAKKQRETRGTRGEKRQERGGRGAGWAERARATTWGGTACAEGRGEENEEKSNERGGKRQGKTKEFHRPRVLVGG